MTVIVCAGYRLLFTFAKVKPFTFVVRSTLSRQIINRYGTNVSPCSTPATMSKKSVSPSGVQTFTFVFYKSSLWMRQIFFGGETVGE